MPYVLLCLVSGAEQLQVQSGVQDKNVITERTEELKKRRRLTTEHGLGVLALA